MLSEDPLSSQLGGSSVQQQYRTDSESVIGGKKSMTPHVGGLKIRISQPYFPDTDFNWAQNWVQEATQTHDMNYSILVISPLLSYPPCFSGMRF